MAERPAMPASGAATAGGSDAAGGRRWLEWQRRRHHSRQDYAEYQFQSARGRLAAIARRIGHPHPRVLDVGCGLGGMSAAYALEGGVVTAVDEELYDPDSIGFAEAFARDKGAPVAFRALADPWPLADAAFDVVFLDSVIEHARVPARLLAESTRVLRPGGLMFVTFPVFYGPFGGHLDDYVRIPWFHLLPPAVVRAALRRKAPRGAYVTPAFVEAVYLSLNRLTFRRFRRLVAALPLVVVEMGRSAFLTTAGNQLAADLRPALARRDFPAVRAALRRIPADFSRAEFALFLLLAASLPLTRVPLLQEAFLGGVRAILRREGSEP